MATKLVNTGIEFSDTTTQTTAATGALAVLDTVNSATIEDNSVGAAELNVSGNGTAGQVLKSDADGSFSWGDSSAEAAEDIFWENGQTVTSNYTIATTRNAGSFGPITINTGVTVTISTNSNWVII
jgi:hypothetical protein